MEPFPNICHMIRSPHLPRFCQISWSVQKMAQRMRFLRHHANTVSRLRGVLRQSLRFPASRYLSNGARSAEQSGPVNHSIPGSWKTSIAIVVVAVGLAGYGISKFTPDDSNVSTTSAAILDEKHLPRVKCASLDDMKKASLRNLLTPISPTFFPLYWEATTHCEKSN